MMFRMLKNKIEVGIDEVARGVLFGRIYGAAVILPDIDNLPEDSKFNLIKDSKKLTRKKRELLYDFIKENAIDYSVSWIDANTIDEKGLQYCNYKVFHDSLDKLKVRPEHILVDGRCFEEYKHNNQTIPHKCVIKGDNKFYSIAAASILAKVEHDRYILDLINNNKELKKYDLENNMGYGTKKHIDAIEKYGFTDYHRKSYKIKRLMKD